MSRALWQDVMCVSPMCLFKTVQGRTVLNRREGAKRDKSVATHTVNWVDGPRIPVELEKVGPNARTQPRSVFYDLSSCSLGNKALL